MQPETEPTDGELLATWYDLQHTVDDADKAAVFLAAAYELGRRGYTLTTDNVWVKGHTHADAT